MGPLIQFFITRALKGAELSELLALKPGEIRTWKISEPFQVSAVRDGDGLKITAAAGDDEAPEYLRIPILTQDQ